MKNIVLNLLIILTLSLNIQANTLTKAQQEKLNSPIVKIQNGIYFIEEYNRINFDKNIFFDGQSLNKVTIKTYATMKKDTIHKEQFIAISSTLSDQIIQNIFMNPQYFPNIKSIDMLTNKPNTTNLTIKIEFKKDELITIITNGKREEKRVISYDEMFHQRLK